MIVDSNYITSANTIRVKFCAINSNGHENSLFYEMAITNAGGITFGGRATTAVVGEKFNIIIEGYKSETENAVDFKVYINGQLVLENTNYIKYTYTSGAITYSTDNFNLEFFGWSSTRDIVITMLNTYCDSYTAVYQPIGGTNKVDFNDTAVKKTEQAFTTTYVKVSGTTMTTSDASDYTHIVVWKSNAPATASADGSSYTFGKSKEIVSVTAFGSDEETSFTAGGFTYVKGAVMGSSGWSGSGNTIYFATATQSGICTALTGNTALTAPADDAQLRLVWDTNIVVAPGTRTDTQQIKYMFEGGSNQEVTQNAYFFQRIGSTVKVMFGFTAYTVAHTGEEFNLRIEIREVVTDLTEDPNKAGTTYRPIELKLFINGEHIATYIDQCDAGSGNYDSMPTRVSSNTLSASCDMMITFSDMYVDRYTAAN